MRRLLVVVLAAALPASVAAFELKDCWQTKDPKLEIAACTHFIDSGTLNADQLPKAYTGRGVGRAKSGQFDLAIADHTKAIELAPSYPLPLVNRGSAYSAMGDYARAIADFDAALALDAKNAGALNNRAWAKLKLNDAAGALPDIEAALKLKPNTAALHDTHGAILEALGRRNEAVTAYARALEIDAGMSSAKEALARLSAQ